MKLTTIELELIRGAIDTHECELIEQADAFDARHDEELKALQKITAKIAREIARREEKAKRD